MGNGKILVGIPTRSRPECVCMLLSSLFQETEIAFDIFIVENSKESCLADYVLFHRLKSAFEARNTSIILDHYYTSVRSEVASVNRILVKASEGYDYLFKVDDDHILEGKALSQLKESLEEVEFRQAESKPVIVCGMTPWMWVKFPGASGPDLCRSVLPDNPTAVSIVGDEIYCDTGHFTRVVKRDLVRSQIGSAANFFMKPDIRILWSDFGEASMFSDAVWYLQLRRFFDYDIRFDTGVNVWHVAAPTGGVIKEHSDREEQRNKYQVIKTLLKGI